MTHGPEQPGPLKGFFDYARQPAPPTAAPWDEKINQAIARQYPGYTPSPPPQQQNWQQWLAEAAGYIPGFGVLGVKWNPEELAILRNMVKSGKYNPNLLPGRTQQSLYSKAGEEGLTTRASPGQGRGGVPPTVARDPKMAGQIDKMLKQNLPYAQIISRLGISDKTLRRYLSEIGSARRGASWNDPQRIQQYKDMIANGFTAKQMATALKTGERTVYDQLYRLTEEGHLNFVPQGGTRTPGMPSFNLSGEAAGDPEYEKALAEFLQGQQSSPARLPEINVPSLEELFDQLTTKRKP